METTFLARFFSLLNELSNAELAKKTGLNEFAQKLLYRGTKAGVMAGSYAQRMQKEFQSRFRPAKELMPGEELQRKAPSGAQLFDLHLTEEQQMTQEMLQGFAKEVMREIAWKAEADDWNPTDFFAQVQELGLNLIAIPEALGGAAAQRSPCSHALMAEALAYGDMGLALAVLAPLGVVNALTEFGSHSQQARYLPAFAEESFVPASIALMEPRACFSPDILNVRAVREGDGYRLNGTKCLVPLCTQAELFLVFAEVEGLGPRGFFVEAQSPGLAREKERYMGLNNAQMGRLMLSDVWVDSSDVLGEQQENYDHAKMIALGRIASCALSVGTCQGVVEYVLRYANERIAFGEPVSHRQAVAFAIADMAIELEGMRLLTLRAASRAEQGMTFVREAHLAHLQCAQKAMEIGSQGVQMLGGHGYICDHPVERWYRQLRATSILEAPLLV